MTADQPVSDEAVEAAARALYEHQSAHRDVGRWERLRGPWRSDMLSEARAALAAAYPLLVADAVAAERERITAAIEAEAEKFRHRATSSDNYWPKNMRRGFAYRYMALRTAARIARNGGDTQ